MISALAAFLHRVSQPTLTAKLSHQSCLSSGTISELEPLFDCRVAQIS